MGTDFPLGASDEGSRLRNLDLGLLVVTMLLGFLHAWASGHSMNPDGMSYLDVGDAFYNHDWVHAVNAWWSPLYPWIVGSVLGIFKPSIELILVSFY